MKKLIVILSLFMFRNSFANDEAFYSKGLRPFLSSFSTSKIRAKGRFNGEDIKISFNTNGALGIGAAYDWIPSEGSGFILAFQRFQDFKIREAEISGGGGAITVPSGQESKITIMVVDINYTYSLASKKAYSIIGLNYSILNFSEPLDLSVIGLQPLKAGSQGGGVGFQVGAGYILSENVIFEFMFKAIELNNETNHFTNFFNPETSFNSSGIVFTLGYSF